MPPPEIVLAHPKIGTIVFPSLPLSSNQLSPEQELGIVKGGRLITKKAPSGYGSDPRSNLVITCCCRYSGNIVIFQRTLTYNMARKKFKCWKNYKNYNCSRKKFGRLSQKSYEIKFLMRSESDVVLFSKVTPSMSVGNSRESEPLRMCSSLRVQAPHNYITSFTPAPVNIFPWSWRLEAHHQLFLEHSFNIKLRLQSSLKLFNICSKLGYLYEQTKL